MEYNSTQVLLGALGAYGSTTHMIAQGKKTGEKDDAPPRITCLSLISTQCRQSKARLRDSLALSALLVPHPWFVFFVHPSWLKGLCGLLRCFV